MKRDECDGALHDIPMREALQRNKCYTLISTVTLILPLLPRRTHHGESFSTRYNAVTLQSQGGAQQVDGHVQAAWQHSGKAAGRRRAGGRDGRKCGRTFSVGSSVQRHL